LLKHETEKYKIEEINGKLVGYEKEHQVLKSNNEVLIQDLSDDFYKSVLDGLNKIKADHIINPGDYVAIKINLGGGIHHVPSTYSDPKICEAIIRAVKELGGIPFVCEANMRAHKMDDKMLKIRGYYDMLQRNKTKFVNLSYIGTIEMKCIGLDVKLLLPKILFYDNVKIISFAPPKPHWECGISCSQKNMYGAIAERRKSIYHRKFDRIDKTVAAAARLMSPDINILGCQNLCVGTGPHFGEPVPFNKLIISEDMVYGDKLCSEIFGYPYKFVKYAMINTNNVDVSYKLHPESSEMSQEILDLIKEKSIYMKEVNFWKRFLHFQYFVPHDFQYHFYPPFEFLFTEINKRFFKNR